MPYFSLQLADLQVALHTSEDVILHEWEQLCGPLGTTSAAPPEIVVTMEIGGEPPAADSERPFEVTPAADGAALTLTLPSLARLYFPTWRARESQRPLRAEVTLTPQALDLGRLEDITTICLAPLLRPLGIYWLHAFALEKDGAALCLVGPSGSGKTSAGLALHQAGWRVLGNDAILIREDDGQVTAYPSPGTVNIAPRTLELLPQLAPILAGIETLTADGKHHVPLERWMPLGQPAPIRSILFPSVVDQAKHALRKESKATALARLLPDSLDNWDEPYLQPQLGVLERLVTQASCFELGLGRQLSELPPALMVL